MKKALIQGTRICEVRPDIFPVHPDLKWVDVPDDATTQDTFEGGQVVKFVQPLPLQPSKSVLEQVIEELRSDPAGKDKLKAELAR